METDPSKLLIRGRGQGVRKRSLGEVATHHSGVMGGKGNEPVNAEHAYVTPIIPTATSSRDKRRISQEHLEKVNYLWVLLTQATKESVAMVVQGVKEWQSQWKGGIARDRANLWKARGR